MNGMKEYKKLTSKELTELRKTKFNNCCPICKRSTTIDEMSLDHIHGSHRSIYPDTNKLCRDLICRDCNVILGKIENQYLRSSKGLKESINLPELLRNLADYVETYSDISNFEELLIHPTEWKPEKIKKSWFNKLKKRHLQSTGKELIYPASGKLTKQLQALCEEYGFVPEYY